MVPRSNTSQSSDVTRPSILSRLLSRLSDNQLRILVGLVSILPLFVIGLRLVTFLQLPYTHSDDCLWSVVERGGEYQMFVSRVPEGGSAYEAGIREGDRVLAIDDHAIPSSPQASYVAQGFLDQAPVDKPISYVVERDGVVIRLSVQLTSILNLASLTLIAFSICWLVIGAMVVLVQPHGRVQQRFFLLSVTVPFALSPLNLTTVPWPWSIILMTIGGLLSLVFYNLWVRFSMTFPIDQKLLNTRGRRLLLNLPLMLYAVLTAAVWTVPSLTQISLMLYQVLILGTAVFYYCLGIWFLLRGYRLMAQSADRRPIAIILSGSIIAALSILYITLIPVASGPTTFLMNPHLVMPIILLLALPISFGYAIFKYQVMDFRLVLRTTLVYTITMAFVAGLYLGLAYLLGQVAGSFIGPQLKATVEVIAFVLFVMLFEPVKRQLQTTIENRFFPQRRDYSRQLAAYSNDVAEAVGARSVAALTAETLERALDLQGVHVAVENRQGVLEIAATADGSSRLTLDPDALDRLRTILESTRGLLTLETLDDPRIASLQAWFSYAIGLYAQGRVIGAVLMMRPEDDEPLSGSQVPFVNGVVAQAASAIEVARLYEEELERQRYLEELNTARRIQQSLLPAVLPPMRGIVVAASSHPAQTVGGDYYDVIDLGEERFLVMIADVSGKGLPASLYMAELHGMVRIASASQQTPRSILITLNDHLCRVMEPGQFITATLLLFDTRRRTVSLARAGHTPMIRRSGQEIDTLLPAGLALGLSAGSVFEETLQQYTVEYESGETFILFSDGVSEAMNGRREEFGDGRLRDVIAATPTASADALRTRILDNVGEFRGDAEQNDDITVVVIRVEEERIIARGPANKEASRTAAER